MKYLVKDYKKRQIFKKYELRRICLKLLLNSKTLKKYEKLYIRNYLIKKQPKNSSITRIKNICTVTGRTDGVRTKFKQSRLSLKRNLLNGYFSGYEKY